MPEPKEVYIDSLVALHATTPTLPERVRVFQNLDQVGRVPMYDARRIDRRIMSAEYTKSVRRRTDSSKGTLLGERREVCGCCPDREDR